MNMLSLRSTCIAFCLGGPLYGNEYRPVMPKTGPTERILVFDISKEKQDAAAYHAVCCLQGLINRTATEKVYFYKHAIRTCPDLASSIAGPGDAERIILEEMIPFPRKYVPLDEDGEYPTLSYLLKHHSALVKGTILYGGSRGQRGNKIAAVNACTFESALPVTERLAGWLRKEGYRFAPIADISTYDDLQAVDWAVERYMKDPRRSRIVCGFGSGLQTSLMSDYWVSVFAFTYFLGPHFGHGISHAEYDASFKKVLASGNFDPAVLHVGPVEGPGAIPFIVRYGGHCVCGEVGNVSVTSSAPFDPGKLPLLPHERELQLDRNGVYITWTANDGDAIDFGLYIAAKNLVGDPRAGDTPLAWKINPHYIDMFPDFVYWMARRCPESGALFFSRNDGGWPQDTAGREAWLEQYNRWLALCVGRVPCYVHTLGKFMGGDVPAVHQRLKSPYVLIGYQGREVKEMNMSHTGSQIVCSMIGDCRYGPDHLHALMKETLAKRSIAGEPYFMVGRLGIWMQDKTPPVVKELCPVDLNARRGILPATFAQEMMRRLKADKTIQRPIYFVSPRDLYRLYAMANMEHQWR